MFFINSNYIGEETIIYFQFNCLDCTNDNFCYDFGNSVIIFLWKIRSFSLLRFLRSQKYLPETAVMNGLHLIDIIGERAVACTERRDGPLSH